MGERIIRNRVISTTSRGSGGNYKVECEGMKRDDILEVNITHASQPDFLMRYEFKGIELQGKKSISFNTIQTGNDYRVTWQGGMTPRRILR